MNLLPFKWTLRKKSGMKTKLIVGLGNPGKEYENTRHNVGFLVLERIAEKKRMAFGKKAGSSSCAERAEEKLNIVLLKPGTFMNLSGEAVKKAIRRYRVGDLSDLIVLVDDADLPFGKLRLRSQGSSGGHRGLESIIQALGTNAFPRLRIGIGRSGKREELRDYVLEPFSEEEISQLIDLLDVAGGAVEVWMRKGCEAAMNAFNRSPGVLGGN